MPQNMDWGIAGTGWGKLKRIRGRATATLDGWLGIQLFFRSSVPNVLFLFVASLWETRLPVVSKIQREDVNDWQLQKGEQYNGLEMVTRH